MKVYLTGGMLGWLFNSAFESLLFKVSETYVWRGLIRELLKSQGMVAVDPLLSTAGNSPEDDNELVSLIKYYINNSDVVLAKLENKIIDVGTVGEITYAHSVGIPVITWGIPAESAVNYHPWITTHTVKHFYNVNDAIDYIASNYF